MNKSCRSDVLFFFGGVRSETHLAPSPCASTISAAGSPACGGTSPRHLLWHRPVNGARSRLGPWCRSSLGGEGRRWPDLPPPLPLVRLLIAFAPVKKVESWTRVFRKRGGTRRSSDRGGDSWVPAAASEGINTWIRGSQSVFFFFVLFFFFFLGSENNEKKKNPGLPTSADRRALRRRRNKCFFFFFFCFSLLAFPSCLSLILEDVIKGCRVKRQLLTLRAPYSPSISAAAR